MWGDSAARERHPRAGIRVIFGQMRNSFCCASDSRGHRLAPVENLDVNSLRPYAHLRERQFHVRHESSRPTKVDIRISWDVDLIENLSRQVSGGVEMLTHLVSRGRAAVANKAASVGEEAHNAADFCR